MHDYFATALTISITLLATIVATSYIWRTIKIIYLKHKGLYPREGPPTTETIKSLLDHRELGMAMYCHRKIYGTSLADAKLAIDKQKNQQ